MGLRFKPGDVIKSKAGELYYIIRFVCQNTRYLVREVNSNAAHFRPEYPQDRLFQHYDVTEYIPSVGDELYLKYNPQLKVVVDELCPHRSYFRGLINGSEHYIYKQEVTRNQTKQTDTSEVSPQFKITLKQITIKLFN